MGIQKSILFLVLLLSSFMLLGQNCEKHKVDFHYKRGGKLTFTPSVKIGKQDLCKNPEFIINQESMISKLIISGGIKKSAKSKRKLPKDYDFHINKFQFSNPNLIGLTEKSLENYRKLSDQAKSIGTYEYIINYSKIKEPTKIVITMEGRIVSKNKNWDCNGNGEYDQTGCAFPNPIKISFTIKPPQNINSQKETNSEIKKEDTVLIKDKTHKDTLKDIKPISIKDTDNLKSIINHLNAIDLADQDEIENLEGNLKKYQKELKKLSDNDYSKLKILDAKVANLKNEADKQNSTIENKFNKSAALISKLTQKWINKNNKQHLEIINKHNNISESRSETARVIKHINALKNNTKLKDYTDRFGRAYNDIFKTLETDISNTLSEVESIRLKIKTVNNKEKPTSEDYDQLNTSTESIGNTIQDQKRNFENLISEYEGFKIQNTGVKTKISGINKDIKIIDIELVNFPNDIEAIGKNAGVSWFKRNKDTTSIVMFFLLLIGSFIGFLFYKKWKAKKNKEQIEFVSSEPSNTIPNNKLSNTSAKNPVHMSKDINSEPIDEDDDIEIEIIEEDTTLEKVITPLHKGTEYLNFDLNKAWADTAVDMVKIHYKACDAIYNFSETSLSQKPAPEVGGFLLGSYNEVSVGIYKVIVEEFLPSNNVEYQNNYELSFGAKALLELDDALERNPQYQNVGWFHTHPGHTPFLSNKDIHLHEGSFPFIWQIAVVLDPNTTEFDTGIFSYKKTKLLNNKADLKSGFFSWESVKKKVQKLSKNTKPFKISLTNYYIFDIDSFNCEQNLVGISRNLIIKLKQLSEPNTIENDYILIQNNSFDNYILLDDIIAKEEKTTIERSQHIGRLRFLNDLPNLNIRFSPNNKDTLNMVFIKSSNLLRIFDTNNTSKAEPKELKFNKLTEWLRLK